MRKAKKLRNMSAMRNGLLEPATGLEPFAISESVLHGFIRIVTNPKIFRPPTPMAKAFQFVDALLERPNCVLMRPGAGNWLIYRQLCQTGHIQSKLAADAAHAALAIEMGCEWISADTDFARFSPPLCWQRL
jgi:toxin-antitoxin system PIN domain toxin